MFQKVHSEVVVVGPPSSDHPAISEPANFVLLPLYKSNELG